MVIVIKFIDKHLGSVICNFLAFFNKKKSADIKADKILVIQLWGIGETILTLPAIEALRKKFPEAEINILATSRNKDVFFNNKDINNEAIVDIFPIKNKLTKKKIMQNM